MADKIRSPLADFLREAARAAGEYQGERFSRIFAEKAEEYLKDSSLTKGDLEEFKRLGEELGYMDVTMQKNNIDLYLDQLKGEIRRTEKEGPARKKLYPALGLMAGMFLAVVLL